jgi:hypothetical protein
MFFTLHILLMAIASLSLMGGVGAVVFFRKNPGRFKIHKRLNSSGFGGIAAGMIMAFIYVSGTDNKHLDGLHQIAGLTAFIFLLITMYAGFYQFRADNKTAIRTMHRWFGRLSLFLLLTTIILGLKMINII